VKRELMEMLTFLLLVVLFIGLLFLFSGDPDLFDALRNSAIAALEVHK